MKKISLLISALIFVVTCVACEAADHTNYQQPKKENFNCSITDNTNSQSFTCLKEACSEAGGKYKKNQCQCGSGQMFTGWETPECKRPEHSFDCYDSSGLYTCDVFLLTDGVNGLYSANLVATNLGAKHTNREFRHSINSLQAKAHKINRGIQHRINQSILLVGPGRLTNEQVKTFFDPIPHLVTEPPLWGIRKEYIYIANRADLKLFADGTNSSLSLPRNSRLANNSGLKELVASFNGVYRINSADIDSITTLGCLGYCKEVVGHLNRDRNFSIKTFTQYRGGVADYKEIRVFDKSQRHNYPTYTLRYDPKGLIQFISSISYTQSSGGFYASAVVYDRNWREIGSYKWPIHHEKQKRHHMQAINQQKTVDTSVVVCEGAFDLELFNKPKFQGLVQFGPSASSTPRVGKSYFGWQNTDGLDSYSEGVFSKSPFGITQSFVHFAKHAFGVSKAATNAWKKTRYNEPVIGLIPITFKNCLSPKNFATWSENVRPRAKIINMSVIDGHSGEICRMKNDFPALNDQHFVWVMAAGNENLENAQAEATICPQTYNGLDNIINVAALDGNWLASYSNSGKNFADIMADGDYKDDETSAAGTSYAAPRVSQVAAKIAALFPNLTASEIRYSILLSVDLSRHYPVRSRGRLDEAGAVKFANELAKNPKQNIEEIIREVYRSDYWFDDDSTELRIEIYRELQTVNLEKRNEF